jgi:hypothetical protein
VKTEEDPLDLHVGTPAHAVMEALRHVEDAVGKADGAVLRYGGLCGPVATEDQVELVRKRQFPLIGVAPAAGEGRVRHRRRRTCPGQGVAALLAACAGAKPPMRIPTWLAWLLAGEVAVTMMTEGRGFSNAKAKRELGWTLRYPSWRRGFKKELA